MLVGFDNVCVFANDSLGKAVPKISLTCGFVVSFNDLLWNMISSVLTGTKSGSGILLAFKNYVLGKPVCSIGIMSGRRLILLSEAFTLLAPNIFFWIKIWPELVGCRLYGFLCETLFLLDCESVVLKVLLVIFHGHVEVLFRRLAEIPVCPRI